MLNFWTTNFANRGTVSLPQNASQGSLHSDLCQMGRFGGGLPGGLPGGPRPLLLPLNSIVSYECACILLLEADDLKKRRKVGRAILVATVASTLALMQLLLLQSIRRRFCMVPFLFYLWNSLSVWKMMLSVASL